MWVAAQIQAYRGREIAESEEGQPAIPVREGRSSWKTWLERVGIPRLVMCPGADPLSWDQGDLEGGDLVPSLFFQG